MKKYYLAVDIGASSGRLIIAFVENGRLHLEEMHRFENSMVQMGRQLCWDIERLLGEIKTGMKKCFQAGKIPSSMGIDSWGVDFLLLDHKGERLGECVAYRDPRTKGMSEKVERMISTWELYERAGIQKQDFNTLYQLVAVRENEPEILRRAAHFLMVPEYLNYRLTGVIKNEYTNATTTQLVNASKKMWDSEIMEALGLPREIFGPLSLPGEEVGELLPQISKEVGFTCKVVLPATHDTGSAVLAVPSQEKEVIYISSGTWSLMGTERACADCGWESMKSNFTNEGGYNYRFRYLKNIMGMWMIQSVRKEMAPHLSYGEICKRASGEQISSIVDCNDERFVMPENMTEAIEEYCRQKGQQVPRGIGQTAAVIYNSLADSYQKTAEELESLTGKVYPAIYVIGGGAQAEYLNRLTADYTGKVVHAGPVEASAVGNLIVQMIRAGEFKGLEEAKMAISRSFSIKTYFPGSVVKEGI